MANENSKLLQTTVLIVDDQRIALEFLTHHLGAHYRIIKAYHGKEALSILEKETIDLIISDIMMPEMDGFELCKAIKTNVESSHIPVILLTAKNTVESKIQGLEYGADVYIEKPFSPDYLLAQIQSLVSNRSKIREHFVRSPLAHISAMANTTADEHFLDKLNDIIEQNLDDFQLDVDKLAKYLNMSRATLYRKVKGVSDLSPNDLIRVSRLKQAARLIAKGQYKIYEISMMVGYDSPARFSRNFQKQFGILPSEYLEQNSQ